MIEIITSKQRLNQYNDTLKRSEPNRCIVSLEEECNTTAIQAHFIQESLLRNIADGNSRVKQFTHLMPHLRRDLNRDQLVSVNIRSAASGRFACDPHDKMFGEFEDSAIDWENPRHKSLLAYRTVEASVYFSTWSMEINRRMIEASDFDQARDFFFGEYRRIKDYLEFYSSLRQSIREALTDDNHEGIRHKIIRIEGKSAIAAIGVIPHPARGARFYDPHTRRTIIEIPSSPIAVTVLPGVDQQMVLLSYQRKELLNVTDLLNGLEYANGSVGKGRFSKKLLEEAELIAISPDAWDSFGMEKQDNILNYFHESLGTNEQDWDIAPNTVNLFE